MATWIGLKVAGGGGEGVSTIIQPLILSPLTTGHNTQVTLSLTLLNSRLQVEVRQRSSVTSKPSVATVDVSRSLQSSEGLSCVVLPSPTSGGDVLMN